MSITLGPVEARIRWEHDDEPYDWGEIEPTAEDWAYLETWGVFGCIVEIRRPACACCGVKQWEVAESLWGILGDNDYHREIESDLLIEVAA